jgi:hypothetical protein
MSEPSVQGLARLATTSLLATLLVASACSRRTTGHPSAPGAHDGPASLQQFHPRQQLPSDRTGVQHSASGPLCAATASPGCVGAGDTDCVNTWYPGPLPLPWWIASPPSGACVERSCHQPMQPYDLCVTNCLPWNPDVCGEPLGSIECVCGSVGTSLACYVTQTCLKQADCPPSMACVVDGSPGDYDPNVYPQGGYCEKTCGTNLDCVYCDFVCGPQGVCELRQPPMQPCTVDCECGMLVCVDGFCQVRGRLSHGLCNPYGGPADCACVGGTCDERWCCVLPDGTIAGPSSPACQPP